MECASSPIFALLLQACSPRMTRVLSHKSTRNLVPKSCAHTGHTVHDNKCRVSHPSPCLCSWCNLKEGLRRPHLPRHLQHKNFHRGRFQQHAPYTLARATTAPMDVRTSRSGCKEAPDPLPPLNMHCRSEKSQAVGTSNRSGSSCNFDFRSNHQCCTHLQPPARPATSDCTSAYVVVCFFVCDAWTPGSVCDALSMMVTSSMTTLTKNRDKPLGYTGAREGTEKNNS